MYDFLIFISYTIGIVALSIIGMFIVRRSISISTLESHHEVAGFIYAIVGGVYAVLIAFVVLVVWEQFNSAEERNIHEASCVSTIYRTSRSFDNESKEKIKELLRNYCESMIKYEFPAMIDMKTSDENKKAYLEIWEYLVKFTPKSDMEKLWYPKVQDILTSLQDARRLRQNSINFGIPPFMWIIIIVGAIITISFTYLFGTKKVMPQAIMVVMLSLMISLVLLLISALENPFSGIIRVDAEPFESVLKILL